MRTACIFVFLLAGLLRPHAGHASGGLSYIRFVHALGGVGALNIYVNGARAIDGIAGKQISDYLAVTAGPVRFAAIAQGEPLIPKTVQFEIALHLQKDTTYTVLMTRDEKTQMNAPILLTDDNTWPNSRHVRLRVVNVNVRPAIDVMNTGGKQVAKAVTYRTASTYVEMSDMAFAPKITSGQSDQRIAQLAKEKLMVGTVYTLFIFDAHNASLANSDQPGLFVGLSIDAQAPLLPITGEDLAQYEGQDEN